MLQNSDSETAFCGRLREAVSDPSVRKAAMSSLSHDMRGPLLAINMACDLLQDDLANDNQRQIIDHVRVAASQLSGMVENVVAMLRLAGGVSVARRSTLDLDRVVDLASASVKSLVESRRQTLERDIRNAPAAQGDPDMVRHILTNLLSNASRFSPVNSTIRIEADRGSKGDVRITVCDQGPGVAEGDRENIFEPYYQHRRGNGRSGVGLSLAVSRELAQMMDGQLHVDRSEDGARFVLTLPAANGQPTAD